VVAKFVKLGFLRLNGNILGGNSFLKLNDVSFEASSDFLELCVLLLENPDAVVESLDFDLVGLDLLGVLFLELPNDSGVLLFALGLLDFEVLVLTQLEVQLANLYFLAFEFLELYIDSDVTFSNHSFKFVTDAGNLLSRDDLLLLDDNGLLRFPLSFFPEITFFHLGVVVSILALQLINLVEESLRVRFILFLQLSNNRLVPSLNVTDLNVLATSR